MHCEDTFLIKNKLGLHARAATVLAQLAVQFDATITLFQDDKEAAGEFLHWDVSLQNFHR